MFTSLILPKEDQSGYHSPARHLKTETNTSPLLPHFSSRSRSVPRLQPPLFPLNHRDVHHICDFHPYFKMAPQLNGALMKTIQSKITERKWKKSDDKDVQELIKRHFLKEPKTPHPLISNLINLYKGVRKHEEKTFASWQAKLISNTNRFSIKKIQPLKNNLSNSAFHQLPQEILLMIDEYLPQHAKVAIRLTSRWFYINLMFIDPVTIRTGMSEDEETMMEIVFDKHAPTLLRKMENRGELTQYGLTFCAYCQTAHRKELFSKEELECAQNDRMCIGVETPLRLCQHLEIGYEDIKRPRIFYTFNLNMTSLTDVPYLPHRTQLCHPSCYRLTRSQDGHTLKLQSEIEIAEFKCLPSVQSENDEMAGIRAFISARRTCEHLVKGLDAVPMMRFIRGIQGCGRTLPKTCSYPSCSSTVACGASGCGYSLHLRHAERVNSYGERCFKSYLVSHRTIPTPKTPTDKRWLEEIARSRSGKTMEFTNPN
jgi:hypothetical protein